VKFSEGFKQSYKGIMNIRYLAFCLLSSKVLINDCKDYY
jgi:hypothetical protein